MDEEPLNKEELRILEPFKKLPKTREALKIALVVNRINDRLDEYNELYDYVRTPLGKRRLEMRQYLKEGAVWVVLMLIAAVGIAIMLAIYVGIKH